MKVKLKYHDGSKRKIKTNSIIVLSDVVLLEDNINKADEIKLKSIKKITIEPEE